MALYITLVLSGVLSSVVICLWSQRSSLCLILWLFLSSSSYFFFNSDLFLQNRVALSTQLQKTVDFFFLTLIHFQIKHWPKAVTQLYELSQELQIKPKELDLCLVERVKQTNMEMTTLVQDFRFQVFWKNLGD